jgi:hypothetical protein
LKLQDLALRAQTATPEAEQRLAWPPQNRPSCLSGQREADQVTNIFRAVHCTFERIRDNRILRLHTPVE